ncbi:hypothetical protein H0I76_11195 [Limibaculum sp. M0105]|uniref:Glycosyl transferase n=1 Tax=Thermohalobaculum xanthum TaxID=2753746 RepID=A0A8J7M8A7_9RHOB|nr:hypothetical protein [Thermohalobaculum xanthum]MBK0399757.1 hypothetical protein [Thermohalobaculum xanthum]
MNMTLGSLILRGRRKFGDGLTVFFYRDIVRPKILNTPPVIGLHESEAEIHVLTSATDWMNLVWTLKSFYAVSPRRFLLSIHGDSTLSCDAVQDLQYIFPDARIITAVEADDAVLPTLREHPKCYTFRSRNTLARKIFDFRHFLRGQRIALFDSDLLFFDPPTAWIAHIESGDDERNVFNEDVGTAYAVPLREIQEHCGEVITNLNSGFGVVYPDSLRLDWLEEFLSIPGMLDGHFWRIEQTLFALCSTRFGVELLPDDYRVYLEPGLAGRPFRHYVGAVRHLMYSEGMRALVPRLLK